MMLAGFLRPLGAPPRTLCAAPLCVNRCEKGRHLYFGRRDQVWHMFHRGSQEQEHCKNIWEQLANINLCESPAYKFGLGRPECRWVQFNSVGRSIQVVAGPIVPGEFTANKIGNEPEPSEPSLNLGFTVRSVNLSITSPLAGRCSTPQKHPFLQVIVFGV